MNYAGQAPGGPESKHPPESENPGFALFDIGPQLLNAVEKMGWTTPTPVQLGAIPPALEGLDVIALAQTGTGKTGAYLLPVLKALAERGRAKPLSPYCVILAPTRELVQQIDTQVKELTAGSEIRSLTIFGGVSDRPQISQLMSGVELVTATPGRLLDLIGRRFVHFPELTHCVLDEADRMFDMGFIADLRRILYRMPSRRQTLLFSATMPPEILKLTEEFLFDPREVRLEVSKPPEELRHEIWELGDADKFQALDELLREDYDSVLVFTRTKHRADRVARQLLRNGESIALLHGNRSQNQRDQALARFKEGAARVLVATDVASRGLDITGIGLVVNFDAPRDPEDYVHRVGRTARAKRQGCAVSLIDHEETKYVRRIENLLKHKITRRGAAAEETGGIVSTNDEENNEPKSTRRRSSRSQSEGRSRRSGGSDRSSGSGRSGDSGRSSGGSRSGGSGRSSGSRGRGDRPAGGGVESTYIEDDQEPGTSRRRSSRSGSGRDRSGGERQSTGARKRSGGSDRQRSGDSSGGTAPKSSGRSGRGGGSNRSGSDKPRGEGGGRNDRSSRGGGDGAGRGGGEGNTGRDKPQGSARRSSRSRSGSSSRSRSRRKPSSGDRPRSGD